MLLIYIFAFLNMFIESSFLPFPSEPFVLYISYLINLVDIDFWITYIFSIFGSLSGAVLNYYLAKKYGLKFFKRWVNIRIIKKFLNNFMENQCFYTFFFRFVPIFRQIMSIPAGIINMSFKKFLIFSFLGIAIWNFILLYLCTKITDIMVLKKDLFMICFIVFLFIILYIVFKNKYKLIIKNKINQ